MCLKKLLIVGIILFALTGCTYIKTSDEKEWFEVVKFEQTAVAETNIDAGRVSFHGKAYLYTIIMMNNKKQVIEKKLISNEIYRFFPGDSIRIDYGRITMKQ